MRGGRGARAVMDDPNELFALFTNLEQARIHVHAARVNSERDQSAIKALQQKLKECLPACAAARKEREKKKRGKES